MTAPDPAIERKLDAAVRLLNAGESAQAEAALRDILQTAPDSADAWRLLGRLQFKAGAAESGLAALRKAEALAPRAAQVHVDLSAALLRMGEKAAALAYARTATELAPGFVDPWRNLARIARRIGDLDAEAAALGKLTAASPGDEKIAVRLAEIETARRRWPEVIKLAQAFLAARPDHEAMREKLSQARLESGDVTGALAAYKPLVEKTPLSARYAVRYGRLCLIGQRFDEAATYLEAAAAMDETAEAAFALGRLYTFLGDLPRAEQACRLALARDPGSAHALVQLTTLLRGRIEDELRTRLESIWQAAREPAPILSSVGFALADAYDAAGDAARAFAVYDAANAVNASHFALDGARYDRDAERRRVALMTELASEPLPPPGPRAPLGFRPIFIVGMPRSGTTLLESILAAHPDVHGAGEVLAGSQILDDFLQKRAAQPGLRVADLIEERAPLWRRTYAGTVGATGGAAHVTDKLPINFRAVGLLARVFPEAAFIHIERDPLDTGLSIFQHSFPKAYAFTHRLEDIGHQYTLYRELMETWRRALPGLMVEVSYERLVDDQEQETRRILEGVGLPWDEACLAFHRAKRPVATFSSVQVRAPMSRSSIGKAERYRPWLGPLIAALGGERTS